MQKKLTTFRQDQVGLECRDGQLSLEDDVMLAYAPPSTALKRATQLVTISVFTALAVNSGATADLPLPLKAAEHR